MKKINEKLLVVSLHDVSPASWRESKIILSHLNKLGIKKSLLIVPNFHGKYELSKHQGFVRAIRKEKERGSELVLHGYYHISEKDFFSKILYFISDGVNEFLHLGKKEARNFLSKGRRAIKRLFGVWPRGFIAPNWSMSKDVKNLILKSGFDYYTTRKAIVYKDKKVNSLVFGFSAGNNPVLAFIVKYFCYLRLRYFRPKIVRFVIHPEEAVFISWEIGLLKGLLKEGYKPVTFSELRGYIER